MFRSMRRTISPNGFATKPCKERFFPSSSYIYIHTHDIRLDGIHRIDFLRKFRSRVTGLIRGQGQQQQQLWRIPSSPRFDNDCFNIPFRVSLISRYRNVTSRKFTLRARVDKILAIGRSTTPESYNKTLQGHPRQLCDKLVSLIPVSVITNVLRLRIARTRRGMQ